MLHDNRIRLSFVLTLLIALAACGGGGSGASYSGGNPGGSGNYNQDGSTPINQQQKATDCPESSCFFFSYDDSASTAAVELTKFAINNGDVPEEFLGRAYEFLNFEQFDNSSLSNIGLFDVSMGVWTHSGQNEGDPLVHELGIHLSSPMTTKQERLNSVLTLLVDVSGSMEGSYLNVDVEQEATIRTRLDVAKYGLSQLYNHSLKEGDVINIVQFSTDSTEQDVILEAWNYVDGDSTFLNTVAAMRTTGSTNLNAGIDRAYRVAIRQYDQTKINRVIILTDAYANTGQTDPSVISNNTRINNLEGIYFSGLGIGVGFNEAFLNELTEAGKGTYMALITPNDARSAFEDRFIGLLNVAARNTRFRLDYPSTINHITTAAEEQSTNQEDVQSTNFTYNTSQFFLEGFETASEGDTIDVPFVLTITYETIDGTQVTESISKTLIELDGFNETNIKDAYLIKFLADLVSNKRACSDSEWVNGELLAGHTSDIANEYFSLIDSYCNLPN